MTLFDFAAAHPWWSLLYLVVGTFALVVSLDMVRGGR